MTRTALISLAVGLASSSCLVHADVFDDFEDGEYTSSPEWFVTSVPGSSIVLLDPIDSSNLVLRLQGTDTAHRRLATEAGIPWRGFALSVDFRGDAQHQADFQLLDSLTVNDAPSYTLRWTRDVGSSLLVRRGGTLLSELIFEYDVSSAWTTLRFWHDPSTDLLTLTVTDRASGGLLGSTTVGAGADFGSLGSITYLSLGSQEVGGQYFDNVRLVTVPTLGAVPLFALASLGFAVRRR